MNGLRGIKIPLFCTLFFLLILVAVLLAIPINESSPPRAVCHTCVCKQEATKCIRVCNSPTTCPIMCATQCQHQHLSSSGRSPDLTQLFSGINSIYFGGSLRATVYLTNQKENSWMGDTSICGDKIYCILVNEQLTPAEREREWTVLHEACHVYTLQKGIDEVSHGPEWQACMLNLADKGAFRGIW